MRRDTEILEELRQINKNLIQILRGMKSWEKKDLAKHDKEHEAFHSISKTLEG